MSPLLSWVLVVLVVAVTVWLSYEVTLGRQRRRAHREAVPVPTITITITADTSAFEEALAGLQARMTDPFGCPAVGSLAPDEGLFDRA